MARSALPIVGVLALAAALVAAASPAHGVTYTTRTYKLTTPIRNMAGASSGSVIAFGGGCTDDHTSAETCKQASKTVDIFTCSAAAGGRAWSDVTDGACTQTSGELSQGVGWPCATGLGDEIVFAGGGVLDAAGRSFTMSAASDVLDVGSAQFTWTRYPNALSVARYGIGCVAASAPGQAPTAYFGGGLGPYTSSSYKTVVDAYVGAAPGATHGTGSWHQPPFALSLGRESAPAVTVNSTLVFAGGWLDHSRYVPTVDVFDLSRRGGAQSTRNITAVDWSGAASSPAAAFVADSTTLHRIAADGSWTSSPLPASLVGGIPLAHIIQNGCMVGPLACFYSDGPAAGARGVACVDTRSGKWAPTMPISVPSHNTGAVACAGNTIMVGGGADWATGDLTDVIDAYTLSW